MWEEKKNSFFLLSNLFFSFLLFLQDQRYPAAPVKNEKPLIPRNNGGVAWLLHILEDLRFFFALFFMYFFRVLMASFFKNFTARLQSKEFRTYLMRYLPASFCLHLMMSYSSFPFFFFFFFLLLIRDG